MVKVPYNKTSLFHKVWSRWSVYSRQIGLHHQGWLDACPIATLEMKATKELARQLGLLRRHSATAQQARDARRIKKTSQVFSYLIVIDFESTCWQDKRNNQEIIEFPAVLLNTSTGTIESEFHYYVLPEENPHLSAFCTEFTGITQDQVESGIPLRLCLSKFSRWLKKLEDDYHITYNSGDDGSNLCTFVTWSDWDLSVCLHYECRRKQLLKPAVLNSWIDLRATYKDFYQRKPNGLNGALQDVGIEFHGRQHSGLDDARNTASLAWRMMCDGCVMKITRTMPGRQQLKRKSTHPQEQPDQQPGQEANKRICEVSIGSQSGTVHNVIGISTSSLRDGKMTGNAHGVHEQQAERAKVNKTGKRNATDGCLIGSNVNKRCTNKPTNALAGRRAAKSNLGHRQAALGGSPSHFIRTNPSNVTSMNLGTTTPQKNAPAVSTVPSDTTKTPREFKTPYLPRAYAMSGSNFKTPIHCDRSRPITSLGVGKITPPMCQCGRRAKRHTVQSPGPNMDRTFYSCPLGRRSSNAGLQDTTNIIKGCGFFKWESAVLTETKAICLTCLPKQTTDN